MTRIALIWNMPITILNPPGISLYRKRGFDRLLGKYDKFHYSTLKSVAQLDDYDGVILSGSSHDLYKDPKDPSKTKSPEAILNDMAVEAEFIRTTKKPVLGICFGHQLIGKIFGADIDFMADREIEHNRKPVSIRVIPQETAFPLFRYIPATEFMVEVSHWQEIKPTPAFNLEFNVYARSDSCAVQVIKHKQRSLFGVQFHPETVQKKLQHPGDTIFRAFLEECNNYLTISKKG